MPMHSTPDHHSLPKLRSALKKWYGRNRRRLPWRESPSPYRIWVSEVMLQQTQISTAIPYYQRFISAYKDVHQLAGAHLDDVLKIWEGLGYYARARNLHRAAQIVSGSMGGHIPDQYEDFRSLPGVGEYIASAVLSIAFDQPYAVVDGNVKRVLARVFHISAPVNRSSSHAIFKRFADALLERSDPGTFNQALMELGALVCRPKRPVCGSCPLRRHCLAFTKGKVDQYPRRVKPKRTPVKHVVAGVIFRNRKVLLTRRPTDGFLGGLWEFPSGTVLDGESTSQACIRIMKHQLNLDVQILGYLTQVKHAYSHFKIIMDVFQCRSSKGRVILREGAGFKWIPPNRLRDYPIHTANQKFLNRIVDPGVKTGEINRQQRSE